MATLITSKPVVIKDEFDDSVCRSDYPTYQASRQAVPFDTTRSSHYLKGKKDFDRLVIKPLAYPPGTDKKKPAYITIGEHYVVKISELKALFEASPEGDYIHIYNSLDENKSNIIFIIPVDSTKHVKEGGFSKKEILTPTSFLIAAFPCPPDPRCPKFSME